MFLRSALHSSKLVSTVSLARRMSTKAQTLFDNIPKRVANLSLGAPSEVLLKKCTGILAKATAHRMVSDI